MTLPDYGRVEFVIGHGPVQVPRKRLKSSRPLTRG
jgi:hypothetical protein